MMSVGLPEEKAKAYIATLKLPSASLGCSIACINSPTNFTIAGEDNVLEKLKAVFEANDVFARKLTVDVA